MKMRKLMTLGVIAPMFAVTVSCSNGLKRITFDEAFNFAINNYDQYHYLGYEPTYIVKANTIGFQDTKTYRQVIMQDSRSYEQAYYLDTTIKDLATTIDTDEISTLQINSVTVRKIASYISIANALLGYFDSFFTLEDGKYLGIYVGSDELGQVINIAGGALAFLATGMIEDFAMDYFELLTADKATLKFTASCNNLGLLDQAHAYIEIDNLSAVLGDTLKQMLRNIIKFEIDLDVITSKALILDLDFIVDYSGK